MPIKIKISREEPAKPPVKEVTLTLTKEDAEALLLLVGNIGGGIRTERGIVDRLYVSMLNDGEAVKVRSLTTSLYYGLKVIRD